MTPADWLLTVLGIYFHDLGMLVTEEEFQARNDSDFPEFRKEQLFAGDSGKDYEDKVAELGEDEERFLYQEYVRYHHAERIADWISGRASKRRGVSETTAEAVASMLSALPGPFLSDLALVCESHHLDDLYDTNKYRVSRPYGQGPEVAANVQYAAILLRTADLLHITSDRTPSVMFRLVNPQDPVSQREWAKQHAVETVRSQVGKDEDGNFSKEAARNTVEVFATYDDAEAFFGLTSYLEYTEKQLQLSAQWAAASVAEHDSEYFFPWKSIDTSNVRAKGFSPQQLSFTLDQGRILDLLTGHTLYNDTGVVLRELVQNSLDAIRLQEMQAGRGPRSGLIEVEWNEDDRELVVRDNGTGMTSAVIERNLLKAGSSRYQEEGFKKAYPEFSSISRFGIGVLSAFMIADSVEIATCTPEEPTARQLTLRSVHGKYLVRLLDKDSDPTALRLMPHGTEVRLRVRKSARIGDVRSTFNRWVVVPRCEVSLAVNEEVAARIAFESPKQALEQRLQERGMRLWDGSEPPGDRVVKVIQLDEEQVSTAIAVQWSRYFEEWAFLSTKSVPVGDQVGRYLVGTCIEGIRVEETTPGFLEDGVVALVDARGPLAPKTNVARAGLEATPERRLMLRRIYSAYIRHIEEESSALRTNRGQSLTWAAQEGESLVADLLSGESTVGRYVNVLRSVELDALVEALRSGTLLLTETDGSRGIVSCEALSDAAYLWTVDSGLVRSAEGILREIPAEGSLSGISNSFSNGGFQLPHGVTLVGFHPERTLYQMALSDREVGEIVIRPEERRIDLAWRRPDGGSQWLELASSEPNIRGYRRPGGHPVFIGNTEIPVAGRNGEVAIRAHGSYYIFADTEIAKFVVQSMAALSDQNSKELFSDAMVLILQSYLNRTQRPEDITRFLEGVEDGRALRRLQLIGEGGAKLDDVVRILEEMPHKSFDPSAWLRRSDLIGP